MVWKVLGDINPSYSHLIWLLQQCLRLSYVMAFASLYPQLLGLIGVRGIMPVYPDYAKKRHAFVQSRLRPHHLLTSESCRLGRVASIPNTAALYCSLPWWYCESIWMLAGPIEPPFAAQCQDVVQ